MAITIAQQPSNEDVVGRKVMLTATSTNSGNTGFKFTVIVTSTLGANTFLIPVNPSGAAILDISQLIILRNQDLFSSVSVHALTAPIQEPNGFGAIYSYTISVQEGWVVSGVYTLQGSATNLSKAFLWSATLQANQPYNQSLSNYLLDAATKRFLSDVNINTYNWLFGNYFGYEEGSTRVFIPVREADFGVLSVAYLTTKVVQNIVVSIIDSVGGVNTFSINVTTHPQSTMWHYPLYPANLNASSEIGWLKPSDFPNWRAIRVQAFDVSSAARSVAYFLYNTDTYGPKDCIQDNVRLAWRGAGGGWEYFNFIKKSEKSYQIERKQVRKVLGTYGSTYVMTGQEAGLQETEAIVDQLITANSDWITEGTFTYLRGLFVSNQVHIVEELTGRIIPVVVEDSNFVQKQTRDGKVYNQQIRLKLSNYLWT